MNDEEKHTPKPEASARLEKEIEEVNRALRQNLSALDMLKKQNNYLKKFSLAAGAGSAAIMGYTLTATTAALTVGDFLLTGGIATLLTGFPLTFIPLNKLFTKHVQADTENLEEKKEQLLKSLPAPGAPQTAPALPAMLKLAGSFNAPAPDGNAATPSTQPKPQVPKS